MTRGPIEGIQGHDDDGEAPGVKAWNRYLEQQDAVAAEEAAARDAAAQAEAAAEAARQADAAARAAQIAQRVAPAPDPKEVAGRAAAGALAAGLRSALTESPDQRRLDVMAALQAEAFARLELSPQPHADAVLASQRASEGTNANPQGAAEMRDIARERRIEGEQVDPAQQRRKEALRPAPDWVAPKEKGEPRDADASKKRR